LAIKVKAVHLRSKETYGSPRIRAQLVRTGETVSEKTVAAIMQQEGLMARRRKRYKATADSRETHRVAPTLLARNFTAAALNQVWVTDVTAVWTLTGRVYLAVILDIFSRRVVGWAMSPPREPTCSCGGSVRPARRGCGTRELLPSRSRVRLAC